jgi:hypothetical protein
VWLIIAPAMLFYDLPHPAISTDAITGEDAVKAIVA